MNLRDLGFDHAIPGGIASVLGSARLMGLTQAQMVEAINIFVSGNNTLFQVRIGKRLHVEGLCVCQCQQEMPSSQFSWHSAGMTGPSPIFEGSRGYFHAVSRGELSLAPFGGKGGSSFKIMECLMKRYPLGQYSQSHCRRGSQAAWIGG